jgi:biopolymer transport protein ExbD
MGDIAFLLIIFFILTSVFMKESHIELQEAASPDVETFGDTALSVVVDAEGVTYFQGDAVAVSSLGALVGEAVTDRPEAQVKLKIDRNLPERIYQPVLMELSETGARIMLVGVEQETPSGGG